MGTISIIMGSSNVVLDPTRLHPLEPRLDVARDVALGVTQGPQGPVRVTQQGLHPLAGPTTPATVLCFMGMRCSWSGP